MNGEHSLTALVMRLTMTLLHSAWQGTLVAVLVLICSPLLRRMSGAARHIALFASLLLIVAISALTFIWVRDSAIPPAATSIAIFRDSASPPPAVDAAPTDFSYGAYVAYAPRPKPAPATTRPASIVKQEINLGAVIVPEPPHSSSLRICPTKVRAYAPWISGVYAGGVGLMLLRLVVLLLGAARLRRDSDAIDDPAILAAVRSRARAMGLRRTPRLSGCAGLLSPAVVGILRPMILLPVSIFSELSPAQLEAILAHELAHISRLDPLLNFVQQLIEAFFFFHPAVWFISARIRREREIACDDLAVSDGGDRTTYADALLRVAEIVLATPARPPAALALNASGHRSHLGYRVLRLMDASVREPLQVGKPAMIGLLLALAAGVAGPTFLRGRAQVFAVQPASKKVSEEASRRRIQQLESQLKSDANFPKTAEAVQELLSSAALGSKAVVEWLLDRGTPVNTSDRNAQSPLQYAVFGGHEEIVPLLIDRGADVKAVDDSGATALHTAMLLEHLPVYVMPAQPTIPMIDRLLAAGAGVNAADKEGRTPLHGARFVKDAKVIQHLCDQGAATDIPDKAGRTPLHGAAEEGNDAAIKVLISKGAKADRPDSKGWTPLQLAAFGRHDSSVQQLLSPSAAPDLYVSIALGEKPRVMESLDQSPNLLNEKHAGWSPLHWAFQTKRAEIAQALVDRGADVNAAGGDQHLSPLHLAIRHQMDIGGLLAKKADPRAATSNGDTPLSMAAAMIDAKLIRELIAAGADVNAKAASFENAICALASASNGSGKPKESSESAH